MPQPFITNINIEYNKKYLNKKIRSVYQESNFFLDSSFSEYKITSDKFILLNELLEMSFKDAFISYMTSERFKNDSSYISAREGEKFSILFEYVAKIFIPYYLFGKGNQKKKPRVVLRINKDKKKKKLFKILSES